MTASIEAALNTTVYKHVTVYVRPRAFRQLIFRQIDALLVFLRIRIAITQSLVVIFRHETHLQQRVQSMATARLTADIAKHTPLR